MHQELSGTDVVLHELRQLERRSLRHVGLRFASALLKVATTLACACAATAVAGCGRGEVPHATSTPTSTPTPTSTSTPTPTSTSTSTVPDRKIDPVGGRWVTCYGSFRPRGAARGELDRLTALCGPPNGMEPLGPPAEGTVSLLAPAAFRFDAEAGTCVRVFAVGESGLSDVGIWLEGPKGETMASEESGDRWPVLRPEGPLCLFDGGRFTVRVRPREGAGKYAAQVWRLAARGSP